MGSGANGRGFESVSVRPADFKKAVREAVEAGYETLVAVSAVDYPEEGIMEVYALLRNREGRFVKVATRLPRDSPRLQTLSDLFPNAGVMELETEELFGVVFEGNPERRPLLLEDWDGPPPFRKDFNWREFVKRELEEVS